MVTKDLENAVHKLRQRIAEHHSTISRINSRLDPIDRRLGKLSRQVKILESELNKLKKSRK